MSLYTEAPPLRPFSDDKPTLLIMWWTTIFSTFIILLRLAGRYIRVERLLSEDRIAALVLVPLYLRAFCVHFVLKYGTNNVQLDGVHLTDEEERRRIIGSRLVLASRIFYAASLWTIKFTTMEFFGRLAGATRKKSHARLIVALRWFLIATFVAVVVSDLAECQPFHHYWQVTPNPGGQCRQGFVHLITTGACNAATDVLLIAFPIPIVWSSRIAVRRKILLVMLFSLSLTTVIITAYRVPQIVERRGAQVTRSMWASAELLAAIAVGNTVALGSFLRDSGIKRAKFKPDSTSGISGSQPTRATRASRWEEEEDMESDEMHKGDGGIWMGQATSHTTTVGSITGTTTDRFETKTMGSNRGVSPARSHDSLISRDQLAATSPEPAVAASPRGVHRGSTIRLSAMIHK